MHLIDTLSHNDKLIIEQSTVFKDIDLNELVPFLNACQIRMYKTGQLIMSSGDAGDGLYIILEGSVEVYLPQGALKLNKSSTGGYKTKLALLEPGQCFGEYSLVDQKKASASVEATSTIRLFHLSTQDFHQLAGVHLQIENIIYKNILQLLISRCRDANLEMDDDVFMIY